MATYTAGQVIGGPAANTDGTIKYNATYLGGDSWSLTDSLGRSYGNVNQDTLASRGFTDFTQPANTQTPLTNSYVDANGTVHNTDGTTSQATKTATGFQTSQNLSGNQPSTLIDNGKKYVTSADPNVSTTVNGYVQPGNADTVLAPPSTGTTANATNTVPGSPNNPTQATTQPLASATVPNALPWAPGHTGADVKALQDMLVSKGFMTAAEQATGPGIFGPKTQAALAAYQAQNGTVNGGSPTAPPASTSPQNGAGGTQDTSGGSTYQNQPATPTTPAKSAVQQVIDDYTTAYNSLGLGDIKTEYQNFVQQQTDLTNKQNEEKQAIDNNPWMTQGVKDKTKAQIDTKYQSQQDTLTHQVSLLDSLYKQGQMEVENIVSKAETIDQNQVKAAADLAQNKQDAIDALQLAQTKNASPTTTVNGLQSGGIYTSGTLQVNNNQYTTGKQQLQASEGKDGYVDPAVYLSLLQDFRTNGGLQSDFLKLYPIKDYVNPANTWPQITALGGGTKPKATSTKTTSTSARSI